MVRHERAESPQGFPYVKAEVRGALDDSDIETLTYKLGPAGEDRLGLSMLLLWNDDVTLPHGGRDVLQSLWQMNSSVGRDLPVAVVVNSNQSAAILRVVLSATAVRHVAVVQNEADGLTHIDQVMTQAL